MQKSTLQPDMMRGTAGGKKTASTTRMTVGAKEVSQSNHLSDENRKTHGTRRRRCPAVRDLRDCRASC